MIGPNTNKRSLHCLPNTENSANTFVTQSNRATLAETNARQRSMNVPQMDLLISPHIGNHETTLHLPNVSNDKLCQTPLYKHFRERSMNTPHFEHIISPLFKNPEKYRVESNEPQEKSYAESRNSETRQCRPQFGFSPVNISMADLKADTSISNVSSNFTADHTKNIETIRRQTKYDGGDSNCNGQANTLAIRRATYSASNRLHSTHEKFFSTAPKEETANKSSSRMSMVGSNLGPVTSESHDFGTLKISIHDEEKTELNLSIQQQRLASLRLSMALSPRNSFVLTDSSFRTKGFTIGASGMRKSDSSSRAHSRAASRSGSTVFRSSSRVFTSPLNSSWMNSKVSTGTSEGKSIKAPSLQRSSVMFAVRDRHSSDLQGFDPKRIQPHQSTNFKTETSFSDFQVFGESGAGASASVLKALRLDVICVYALKSIDIHSQEKRRQLVKELQTFCSIMGSPHTINFHGAYYNAGRAMLVLEYMNRGSLQNVVEECGALPEHVILHFAKQMFLALEHIHRYNLVHRDIKPGNLLIGSDGTAKLTDFGIAQQLQGRDLDTFIGTQMYMGPERLNGESYDTSTDIWSAGVILAFCALGEYPFDANQGFFGILQSIQTDTVATFDLRDYSQSFRNLLTKCLELTPADRGSARELLQDPIFDDIDFNTKLDWNLSTWSKQDEKDLQKISETIADAHCFASCDTSSAEAMQEMANALELIAKALGTESHHVAQAVATHITIENPLNTTNGILNSSSEKTLNRRQLDLMTKTNEIVEEPEQRDSDDDDDDDDNDDCVCDDGAADFIALVS